MRSPLPPGAKIGIFSPSGPCDPQRLARGLERVRSWGFEPIPCPHACTPCDYLAGTDEERLRGLVWALSDPDLDAAWLTRGGYGITRLLPDIPWEKLCRRPVIGFSDATALLYPLWRRGWPWLVHGPVLHSLADHPDEASVEALRRLLQDGEAPALGGRAEGSAAGPMVGGNLCLLAALCGTPEHPRFRDALLLLEDVAEQPYRLDRYFIQLRDAGALEGVRGIVLGEFHRCEPEKPGRSAQEVLEHEALRLGVPVARQARVGHSRTNLAFLYGGRYRLEPGGVFAAPEESLRTSLTPATST